MCFERRLVSYNPSYWDWTKGLIPEAFRYCFNDHSFVRRWCHINLNLTLKASASIPVDYKDQAKGTRRCEQGSVCLHIAVKRFFLISLNYCWHYLFSLFLLSVLSVTILKILTIYFLLQSGYFDIKYHDQILYFVRCC